MTTNECLMSDGTHPDALPGHDLCPPCEQYAAGLAEEWECPGCHWVGDEDHHVAEAGGFPGHAGGPVYFVKYTCGFAELDESGDVAAAR